MALKSMKVTAAERKAREAKYDKPCVAGSSEQYPWGLRINLDSQSMAKLGFDDPFPVEKVLTMNAKVRVISGRCERRANGEDECSMELQIESMELTGGSAIDAMDEGLREADEE